MTSTKDQDTRTLVCHALDAWSFAFKDHISRNPEIKGWIAYFEQEIS